LISLARSSTFFRMKALASIAGAALFLAASGCANFIREADAVVPDAVPGTAKAGLDDLRFERGLVLAKIRFTCQKRLYTVTNIYETPYEASAELYEVPVGLVTIVPSFLWYGVSQLVTLGSVNHSTAVAPIHWSAAGLNPFLNVENGMFVERYRIRRKPGSQRPQEGSHPEPYDAVIAPKSPVKATFEGGGTVEIPIPDEVGITLNLIEAARAIPGPKAQRLDLVLTLQWNMEAPPVEKSVPVYLDADLAAQLDALRETSRMLFTATSAAEREKALEQVARAGFSREAAMLRDRLPPLPRS
jgi:hypothetical protein